MAVKRRYRITLPPPTLAGSLAGARARPISDSDADELGQLMLDAYRDTIDDEGETLNDAVGIVQQLIDRDDPSGSTPGRSRSITPPSQPP